MQRDMICKRSNLSLTHIDPSSASVLANFEKTLVSLHIFSPPSVFRDGDDDEDDDDGAKEGDEGETPRKEKGLGVWSLIAASWCCKAPSFFFRSFGRHGLQLRHLSIELGDRLGRPLCTSKCVSSIL